ncbi:hypothetical protein [Frateuria sp. STR12]|uniref:hypothetical protein n=1 Tax=Frateuria hangzhouensis TaxID=2995589 RepID=UPI002260C8A0|nr:hypothetical protein [Frateuria sp. STR12]MCX7514325.1 hypothetical protein [Frateuria sp. STR12]
MSNVVLWTETDHKTRAELLAQTCNTQAIDFKATAPVTLQGLDTLTFWGHGFADSFCGLKVEEFVDVVSGWVKSNKGVQTVEMISCNLRHRQGSHPDSFTTKLVSRLKKKHAKITFKALPVARTKLGVTCEFSILQWHPRSRTWAYCAAPGRDDKYMFGVCLVLQDHMPPRGNHDGFFRAYNSVLGSGYLHTNKIGKDATGSTKIEACRMNDMLCIANNAYMLAGAIGSLRWHLVDIRA